MPDWPATDADGQARVDDPSVSNTGLGPVAHADRGAYEFVPSALAVGDPASGAPSGFALLPVAPNPMRGSARFGFTAPVASVARLTVIDLQGRIVATLAEGRVDAGRHETRWDGRTTRGAAGPGLYFLCLDTPGARGVRRFVIAR